MRQKNAKSPSTICLVLHKKSCNRSEVRAAVDYVKGLGVDLHVHIPWSGTDLHKFVRQVVRDGVGRIVAGGGDGTVNAVVNAMIRKDKRPEASPESFRSERPTISQEVAASMPGTSRPRWSWPAPDAPRRSTSGG